MSAVYRLTRSVVMAGVLTAGLLTAASVAVPTSASAAPVAEAAKFLPLPPQRVLDTRAGNGAPQGLVPAGGTVSLQVTGRGGVPAVDVSAVVLNVTITGTTGTGHVSVYPTGTDGRQSASAINHTGLTPTIAGLVTAPVGVGGQVTLFTARGGHLVADVFGYYAQSGPTSDGRFVPLAPARTLDTRNGTGMPAPANPGDTKNCGDFATWEAANNWFWTYYPSYGDVARLDGDNDRIPCEGLPGAPSSPVQPPPAKPAAGQSVTLQVAGRGGVPSSGVTAVAVNVTATQTTQPGYVQVVPTDGSTALGTSSNLNASAAGQSIANLVTVPVGSGGRITLFTSGGAHLIADVAGYYTDATASASSTGLFQAVTPSRELDTRKVSAYWNTTAQPVAERSETRIDMTNRRSIPSTGVLGVVLNVAAVAPSNGGYVQVFPSGQATLGASSNINYSRGQVIANAALAPLGDQGHLSLYASSSTHLIADVYGYFLDGSGGSVDGGSGALEGLQVAPHNTTVAYARAEWVHWIDEDGDCQDTRAEVLIEESIATPTFSTAAKCTVVSGQWQDPYSGQTWTAAADLDVDHTVALHNAHVSGGHAWDKGTKRAYANDLSAPGHLNAIEDNLNSAKGASAPDQWRPPLQQAWCDYAADWASIKKRWSLTVTQSEYDALAEMLATC